MSMRMYCSEMFFLGSSKSVSVRARQEFVLATSVYQTSSSINRKQVVDQL